MYRQLYLMFGINNIQSLGKFKTHITTQYVENYKFLSNILDYQEIIISKI